MRRRSLGRQAPKSLPWWVRRADLLGNIESTIEAEHPLLRVQNTPRGPIVKGRIQVLTHAYDVWIEFPADYDEFPVPALWEVSGRIPRTLDRHINGNGTACTCVPEEWIVTAADTSFQAYLAGPVRDFFIGQAYYDEHQRFPWEGRRHGLPGVLDAYASVLSVDAESDVLLRYLDILSSEGIKGHWDCPCASGKRVRNCCRFKLEAAKATIAPSIAKRMKWRILNGGQA